MVEPAVNSSSGSSFSTMSRASRAATSAVLGGFIGAGGVFVSAALNRVPLVAVRQQAFHAGSFMGVILAVGTLVR